MSADQLQTLIHNGMRSITRGETLMALMFFEDAARIGQPPLVKSCLGYCLARERQQYTQAVSLCLSAQQREPQKGIHYLNLGRVYLLAGEKRKAIQTFRQGLRMERSQDIINELKLLGQRREPPIKTLPREHPLNRNLGIALTKMRLR